MFGWTILAFFTIVLVAFSLAAVASRKARKENPVRKPGWLFWLKQELQQDWSQERTLTHEALLPRKQARKLKLLNARYTLGLEHWPDRVEHEALKAEYKKRLEATMAWIDREFQRRMEKCSHAERLSRLHRNWERFKKIEFKELYRKHCPYEPSGA